MVTLIDRNQLQDLIKHGAQLVEVLPAKEYVEDHIPGAISIPLRQLDHGVDQLDRGRPVIIYCWDAG